MIVYTIARALVYYPIRLLYRLKVEGIENIPTDKGFILCSNHRSNLDPFFYGVVLKQQMRFFAKEELFRIPLVAWFVRSCGAFQVRRGAGDTKAIDQAVEVVNGGQILMIFPEGTRSFDGKLLKIKSGAMVIASKTGADLLPAVILCKGKIRPFKKVTLRFGEMIKNNEIGVIEGSPREIRSANMLLTERLKSLLGME